MMLALMRLFYSQDGAEILIKLDRKVMNDLWLRLYNFDVLDWNYLGFVKYDAKTKI